VCPLGFVNSSGSRKWNGSRNGSVLEFSASRILLDEHTHTEFNKKESYCGVSFDREAKNTFVPHI